MFWCCPLSALALRYYTHFVKAKSGFQPDLDKQLLCEARLYDEMPEFRRMVCLIFDEMKVKEDLVYNKHSGDLIGFANIGEINEQLLKFEQAERTPKAQTGNTCTYFYGKGLAF